MNDDELKKAIDTARNTFASVEELAPDVAAGMRERSARERVQMAMWKSQNAEASAASGVRAEEARGTPAAPQGGVKSSEGGQRVPVESDAVQIERMRLENSARMKQFELALGAWKDQRDDVKSLRDRELAFDDWRQRRAIEMRDRVSLLAAKSYKREWHGTFSGGFMSSSWAGPKENPYAALLKKLDGEIGGNPYSSVREETGRRGLAVPDWLRDALPADALGQRKTARGLVDESQVIDVNGSVFTVANGQRQKASEAAKDGKEEFLSVARIAQKTGTDEDMRKRGYRFNEDRKQWEYRRTLYRSPLGGL